MLRQPNGAPNADDAGQPREEPVRSGPRDRESSRDLRGSQQLQPRSSDRRMYARVSQPPSPACVRGPASESTMREGVMSEESRRDVASIPGLHGRRVCDAVYGVCETVVGESAVIVERER